MDFKPQFPKTSASERMKRLGVNLSAYSRGIPMTRRNVLTDLTNEEIDNVCAHFCLSLENATVFWERAKKAVFSFNSESPALQSSFIGEQLEPQTMAIEDRVPRAVRTFVIARPSHLPNSPSRSPVLLHKKVAFSSKLALPNSKPKPAAAQQKLSVHLIASSSETASRLRALMNNASYCEDQENTIREQKILESLNVLEKKRQFEFNFLNNKPDVVTQNDLPPPPPKPLFVTPRNGKVDKNKGFVCSDLIGSAKFELSAKVTSKFGIEDLANRSKVIDYRQKEKVLGASKGFESEFQGSAIRKERLPAGAPPRNQLAAHVPVYNQLLEELIEGFEPEAGVKLVIESDCKKENSRTNDSVMRMTRQTFQRASANQSPERQRCGPAARVQGLPSPGHRLNGSQQASQE